MGWGLRRRKRRINPVQTGWVVEQALSEGAPDPPRGGLLEVFKRNIRDRPVRSALFVQTLLLASAIAVYFVDAQLLDALAPEDAAASLGLIWQVDAVSVSLAFAGLALLFQLATDTLLTGISVRTALFRETAFEFAFSFSIIGMALLGVLALWLDDDSTIIVAFIVTIASLSVIAYAYSRAADVFKNPEVGEAIGRRQLLAALRDSIGQGWAEARGNAILLADLESLFEGYSALSSLAAAELVPISGRLADVHEARIAAVIRDLRHLAGPQDSIVQEAACVANQLESHEGPELLMNHTIGFESRVDRSIFTLYHDGSIDASQRHELNARLRDAIRVRESGTDRSFQKFEAETRQLSDSSTASLQSGDFARVDHALGIYKDLLREVLDEHRRLNRSVGVTESFSLLSGYGREWTILIANLHRLVEVLVKQPHEMPWRDFTDFIYAISHDAAERSEWAAWKSYWSVADEAWRGSLRSAGSSPAIGIPHILSNLATFGASRNEQTSESELRLRAAASFVALTKTAIDADAEGPAIECVEFFVNTFDTRYPGDACDQSQGDRPVWASCLILCYAWILFRVEARESGDLPALRERLSQALGDLPTWEGMKGDVNSRVGEYTESTWWELVMKGGQGGGIRTLGEYEQLAALTAGVNVPTPAEADSLDFELASRIKRLLDGLSAGEHAVLMQLPGIHPGGFGSTRTAIDDLLQWEEISKKRRLATVALDADRIVLFRASLLSRLTQSRGKGLASWFPDGEATPSHGEFLGSVVRVPKWFFVEGTVHADPEGLGRDMATALIRGEDGVVLEALRRTAEGDGKGSKLDVPAVEDWIRRRITSEGDWAIVTNSWRAFELLVPRWWLQGRTNGDDHESSFGCPCRRISRSGPEFVVLVDRGNAVLTHRGQLAARDDAFLDAGMQLLIGVRELFESEIDQLAQSDPPVNEIDAKAQVRVEVVEIFDVTSSEHPRVFWGEVATP